MKYQVVTGWVWCTEDGEVIEENRVSSDDCKGEHYKLYTNTEEIVDKVTRELTKGES